MVVQGNIVATLMLVWASSFNPIALRTAKTLWSFDRSECNRVKVLC